MRLNTDLFGIMWVLQAVEGSVLVANGTIIVADAFKRSEMGKAMGILSMVMATAFVVGPILGGFLTIINWRLNFFINVPIGIVVTIWAHLKLKDVAELPKGETFDLKEMVLFTIAFITSMIPHCRVYHWFNIASNASGTYYRDYKFRSFPAC